MVNIENINWGKHIKEQEKRIKEMEKWLNDNEGRLTANEYINQVIKIKNKIVAVLTDKGNFCLIGLPIHDPINKKQYQKIAVKIFEKRDKEYISEYRLRELLSLG